MSAGLYCHIPYCLQQCPYCDFATVLHDNPLKSQEYIKLLQLEIQNRKDSIPFRHLSTIYFGGGTPSLLSSDQFSHLLSTLRDEGFTWDRGTEITLEINPGTLMPEKLLELLALGFNRFSVGAQTFDSGLLKSLGRHHSVEETLSTLKLLKSQGVNFSLDLLYALPNQTLEHLHSDLAVVKELSPPHVSAYCLTLPDVHWMQKGRPHEDQQVEMIEVVRTSLEGMGIRQYEISNFCQPGFESRNNGIYWGGHPYWGIGMSAHSYLPHAGPWGSRFWNPPTLAAYRNQILSGKLTLPNELAASQFEVLECHQALTDFLHVRLRTRQGVDAKDLRTHFSHTLAEAVLLRLQKLVSQGLVVEDSNRFQIAATKQVLSEQVFKEMTFLKEELA